ncbi:hypothetical protein SteCoe_2652 [Stentor coeruleus]|uniref:Ubiquitin carboxyl-terminal hydrolase n=1 Tax=Stentor coeruleus TaxID=5963 RepID=A0A1R2CYV4_9CILI|nr:hypothetical protein SteCoe_2652 [Stentor coeruleus]
MSNRDKFLKDAIDFYDKRQYKEAIASGLKSQEIKPSLLCKNLLAIVYIKIQEYTKSIEVANEGLKMLEDPQNFSLKESFLFKLNLNISKAYKFMNDLKSSQKVLQELLTKINDKQQISIVKKYIKSIKEIINWTDDYRDFKHALDMYKIQQWDKFFILSADWLEDWENYNKNDSGIEPGKVINFHLLENLNLSKFYQDPDEPHTHKILKPDLQENKDYVLLPEEAYKIATRKYQVDHEIIRYAHSLEENDKNIQVEISFLKLNIVVLPSVKGVPDKNIYTSKKKLVFHLRETLAKLINPLIIDCDLDSKESKIWKVSENENLKQIDEKQQKIILPNADLLSDCNSLEECEILPSDILILEFRNTNGTWKITKKQNEVCANCRSSGTLFACSQCKVTKYCSQTCQHAHFKFHKINCKSYKATPEKQYGRGGLVGLQNLGNTCFMNSALQCLSHTFELTEYFLNDRHRDELNYNNPLGTKGAALALAYAKLVEEMWKGTSSVVSPWEFKKVLSKFAAQFSGYQQHDSHELLSFLLTGLHEDLNRVLNKKYKEMPDVTDKPDIEAANELWELFKERNDSIIVDLMYGQNKSTLTCPTCNKVSVVFDPFLTLSAVVPNAEEKTANVFLLLLNKKVTKVQIKIDGLSQIKSIIDNLQELHQSTFITFTMDKFMFKKFITPETFLYNLNEGTFFMSEAPENLEGYIKVPLKVAKSEKKGHQISKSVLSFPRLLFVAENSSVLDIYRQCAEYFSQIYEDNHTEKPHDLEDFQTKGLFVLNFVKKSKGPCPFCKIKCEGCKINLDLELTCAQIAEKWKAVGEILEIEIEFATMLNFISVNQYNEEKPRSIVKKKGRLDLKYCLDISTLPEKLDENNKWYCNTCKAHVCATKQMQIYKLPKILLIHLLRFKKKGFFTEKITTPVDFPTENFEMSSISESKVIYDLFAISNHFGGMGGGHYTAYIKKHNSSNWYEMDDSRVSNVSETQIGSSSAYVLFYKRRDS